MDRLERLTAFKEQHNLTWTDIAEKLGFDVSYLSLIANGKRPVNDSFMWRFSQAYGSDITRQVFGNNCPAPEAQPE